MSGVEVVGDGVGVALAAGGLLPSVGERVAAFDAVAWGMAVLVLGGEVVPRSARECGDLARVFGGLARDLEGRAKVGVGAAGVGDGLSVVERRELLLELQGLVAERKRAAGL